MSKSSTRYTCSQCGHTQSKWVGRCPSCEAYNTMEEQQVRAAKSGTVMGYRTRGMRRTLDEISPTRLDAASAPPPRRKTGLPELDRTLGGGIVEGSILLLGGDPGVGKSTLLLQLAAQMANDVASIYISGEESRDQIQLRAARLGITHSGVRLVSSSDALAIADHIETLEAGSLVIVDSIQTLTSGGEGVPGSVSQVRAAAAELIPAAKNSGVALILVSQVTKEGAMAGPNLLQHAVDATLYIETDMSAGLYRLLRTEKNRFGPTGEIGVFEMTEHGLKDVANPSEIFIAQRDPTAFGTIIFPSLEGTRPLLLEVQALVAPTSFGTGRRSANGWDTGRLNMLLATIGARLGLPLGDCDVYINVAGGLKVTDPAMDLAVALAVLSSQAQTPLPPGMTAFGEVGLAGEVRNPARAEARLREAARMGLDTVICPDFGDDVRLPPKLHVQKIRRLAQILLECEQFDSLSGKAA